MRRVGVSKYIVNRIREITRVGEVYTAEDIINMLKARGQASDATRRCGCWTLCDDGAYHKLNERRHPRPYRNMPSLNVLGLSMYYGMRGMFEPLGKGKDSRQRYRRVEA